MLRASALLWKMKGLDAVLHMVAPNVVESDLASSAAAVSTTRNHPVAPATPTPL